jgi:hypothetical protein
MMGMMMGMMDMVQRKRKRMERRTMRCRVRMVAPIRERQVCTPAQY